MGRWEVCQPFVDEQVGKRTGARQDVLQQPGAPRCEHVGGVAARGQCGDGGVHAVQGEGPVGAFGGDASGEVSVGGHDRLDAGAGGDGGELDGLLLGERGPQRCHPDVTTAGGQGDRDGVHGSLDEDRDRPGGEPVGVGDVQLVALDVGQGGGGVEVLRAVPVVGVVRVTAADETEDVAVVGDGEDGAVAEPVNEPAGAGGAGDAGGEQLLVVDAVAAQVGDEAGPGVGCVPGADGGVPCEVAGEAVAQV